MLISMAQETNRNGTPSTGRNPATTSTAAGFGVDRRQQGARRVLAREAVERKGVEGGEVIEVVPQELRSVGREQLAADQHTRDGQPEAEHERDDEDLNEHRGMGQ